MRPLFAFTILTAIASAQAPPVAPAPANPSSDSPARQGGVPSYKDLRYPPLKAVRIPEIATFTLPNGMKLYLLEDHELPLVSGFALVRTGNLFDPKDKVGLATLTGTVLRSGGTKSKTGDQIDEQLENIAASVESNIGETNGRVSFSALRENSAEVLAIFRDLLIEPEFRQDKLDLAKTQFHSSISRRNDDAGGIASREFSDTVYGRDNPYGFRMEHELLDRIARNDLVAFHRRHYFPANVILAVYGDFSTAKMKADLEALFSGWTVQQPPVPAFPAVTARPAVGVHLAAKSDVTQTFFEMGQLGGILRDKDYPALEVMGDILGGGFSSRLFRKVRTELGYAYSVGASWAASYNHPGVFRISGSTKSASTTDTLRVILEEVGRIRSAEVTDQELATARDTVLNGFVFNFDRPSKTLSRLVLYDYFGYPKDFLFQYQKAVAAVTKADVLRVAQQYLKPESFTIVAVGKPDDFGQPLTALKLPVHPIDLTIPEPKQAAARSDAASLERGRQLLARVQQAVGGVDKLAAIKDVTLVADVAIETGGVTLRAKQRTYWAAPSYYRQESDLPFGKLATFYDGTTGWMSSPQGMAGLGGPVLAQVQGQVFRDYFGILLSNRKDGRNVNHAGAGMLDISDKQGNATRLEVDEKTGLPVKQSYQTQGPGGATPVEEIYSDFREVNGIRVPHKITIMQGGRKFGEATMQEVKLDTGLKSEDLSKRP